MNFEVGYIESFIKELVSNYFNGSYLMFLLTAYMCFAIVSVSIYLLIANKLAKKNNMSLWKYIRKIENNRKIYNNYDDYYNYNFTKKIDTDDINSRYAFDPAFSNCIGNVYYHTDTYNE